MDADQALNIWIKMGLIGQENAETAKAAIGGLKQSTDELTTHLPEGAAAWEKYKDVLQKVGEGGAKGTSFLGGQKELIGSLSKSFPALGEAAEAAMNPVGLAVFAVKTSFEILKTRIENAEKALSDITLPDLTSGLEQAKNLSQGWHGIENAVENTTQKFNSAEAVYGRTKQSIDGQADSIKKLLKSEKEREEANLESHKGSMDQATYDAKKKSIETSFDVAEGQVDRKAKAQDLTNKYNEQYNAQIASENAKKAADKIKLPESEEIFKAQQDALKKSADIHRQSAQQARQEVDKIRTFQTDAHGGFFDKVKALSEGSEFAATYGVTEDPQAIAKFQTKRALNDEDIANSIEKTIARRQAEFDQKQKNLQTASQNAATATQIGLELPGDRAKWVEENATSAATSDLNIGRALADKAKAGTASQDDMNRLMGIGSVIAGHNINLNQAINMMENGANNMNTFMNQVSRMTTVFSQLSPQKMQDLQRQIDEMEQRLNLPKGQ